ncbi:MAG: ATP-binding protein [Myxococcota bacterium]
MPEDSFDRITDLAARLLKAPIALVSLIDSDRQWFKSRVGIDEVQTPRGISFCEHAIASEGETFVIQDACEDTRFKNNPLVNGPPYIRFYAAAPLRLEGCAVGTLCVADTAPRTLTESDLSVLKTLGELIVDQLLTRKSELETWYHIQLLQMAEEAAKLGHWRIDYLEKKVFWSPQVFKIHGLKPGEYQPDFNNFTQFYHPEDREDVRASLRSALESKRPFEYELRLMHQPTGTFRLVHARGIPQLSSDGTKVRSIFGVLRDITDREELHRRLSHAEKMASVGTLAAGVGHEINNPLNYIKTNADLLLEELDKLSGVDRTKAMRECLSMAEDISEGANRIARIVNSLKTLSRASDGRREKVDLRQSLTTAQRICQSEIRSKAQVIEDFSPQTPNILADEGQIVQIAVNLIVNAAQSMSEESFSENQIRLRTGIASPKVAFFEVEDNGSGMEEHILTRAFDPFFTTKPPGVGTGIGLAVCHNIVATHRGGIEIWSKPGSGTSIRVTLPTADTLEELTPAPSLPPPSITASEQTVLIVDDEPLVGRSLARALRAYETTVFTSARLAIELLKEGTSFDVIICDLMMPGINGVGLYRFLEQHRPDLVQCMLFVTGAVFSSGIEELSSQIDIPILTKPVSPNELRKLVERMANAPIQAHKEQVTHPSMRVS